MNNLINNLVDFLRSNSEWLFSGVGIGIISLIVSIVVRTTKTKNTMKFKNDQGQTIRSSLNIKSGGMNINIGDKSDEDIIILLSTRKKDTNK